MENGEDIIKNKVKRHSHFIFPSEPRRELIALKLTKSEREMIVQAAKARGKSISEFIREAINLQRRFNGF